MNQAWEDKFRTWAQSPSKTETERLERTDRVIRAAIQASRKLAFRDIKVFTQGSYRNRTNVRRESDIDVGVLCSDVYFGDYPEGVTSSSLGHSDANYTYAQFKNEVGEALL
jgi:tRNA nucleotidyltransferase (CCA-adding enzyme)